MAKYKQYDIVAIDYGSEELDYNDTISNIEEGYEFLDVELECGWSFYLDLILDYPVDHMYTDVSIISDFLSPTTEELSYMEVTQGELKVKMYKQLIEMIKSYEQSS